MSNDAAHNMVKYLFEEDFEEPTPKIDPDAPEADAGLSNSEIEQMRAQIFEEGRQQGIGEAKASIEMTASETLQAIGVQLDALLDDRRTLEARLTAEAGQLAHVLAKRLAAKLMAAHPLAEIENLTRECLAELNDEPRVVIRLHESLMPAVKERLDGMAQASGYEGNIVLLGDDQLGPLDCRVEWANGGAERRMKDILAAVDSSVARYLDTLSRRAETAAQEEPAREDDETTRGATE